MAHTKEERDQLARDIGAMKRETEENWASERVENAVLRERINDVAAEVARLTSALEGPNSPIDAHPGAETSRGRSTAAPVVGASNVEMAEPSDKGNLADRIRALQSRMPPALPQGDDPKSTQLAARCRRFA